MRLTKRQRELYRMLKGGGRLISDVTGWRAGNTHRKMREETRAALELTRELVEVSVQGKKIRSDIIVHKNHVAIWCDRLRNEGKRIIRIQPRDDD